MSLFGGGSGDGGAAQAEAARQNRISQGQRDIDQQFAQFDEPFYQKAATDYTAATTPKLLSDFQTTKNNLTYALARSGALNSSVAVNKNASLDKTLAANEATVTNNAQDRANQLRGNVSTQKGNLVNQLESSGDPTAIAGQAQGATASLRAPSIVQPLGNLFADWSQQYLAGSTNNAVEGRPTGNVWNNLMGNGGGGGSGSSVIVN